jgi:hypothetical protein
MHIGETCSDALSIVDGLLFCCEIAKKEGMGEVRDGALSSVKNQTLLTKHTGS